MRRRIIYMLITLLVMLATLELLLRVTDTSGRLRYRYDNYLHGQRISLEQRGYSLTPGAHRFSNWTATIHEDRTRLVPDTNLNADKTLVLMGDSVTFGFGVNDDETWANLLARQYPCLRIVNAGVNAYNSTQALRSIEAYPADAYLWLAFINDMEHEGIPLNGKREPPTYLALALRMALTPEVYGQATRFEERFYSEVETALQDTRMRIVAFDDDEFGRPLQERYPAVHLIDWYTERISAADGHANAAGNRQISTAVAPLVREFVPKTC